MGPPSADPGGKAAGWGSRVTRVHWRPWGRLGLRGGCGPPTPQITVVDSFILVTYQKPLSKWRHDRVFVCFLEESVKGEKYKMSREHIGLLGHQEQTLQCLGHPVNGRFFCFCAKIFFFFKYR